jgi:hypothetical protein
VTQAAAATQAAVDQPPAEPDATAVEADIQAAALRAPISTPAAGDTRAALVLVPIQVSNLAAVALPAAARAEQLAVVPASPLE